MNPLDALDPRFRLILCDIWGCVHDGARLYPGAAERLVGWRGEGRAVVLITNAPRTADVVAGQLAYLGLPRAAWDGIATAGEAGIDALRSLGGRVGFIGTAADQATLEVRGVGIAADGFTDLACCGLREGQPDPAAYRGELARLAARAVRMHCLNPDRVVIQDGVEWACAGALADIYEALGGAVAWYGKPFPAIYHHALSLAGNPPPDAVLAIGDGLATDIAGAARMGFDAIFVAGGIHQDRPLPADLGLGAWRPLGEVNSLA